MIELRTACTLLALAAAAVLPPAASAAGAADEQRPVRVELDLRTTTLLPSEPLVGTVTVTNTSQQPVTLLGEEIDPVALEYRREGETWSSLPYWWRPPRSPSLPSRPIVLAPAKSLVLDVGMHAFADGDDGPLIFEPGEIYSVRATIPHGQDRTNSGSATVKADELPATEEPAGRALGQLRRALLTDVRREPGMLTGIRDFVSAFPDSAYSNYLRRTYLKITAWTGPPLTDEERAPIDAYVAHLKEHAGDLLAPLVKTLREGNPPVRVDLTLRKTRLLAYEPVTGQFMVTNVGGQPVELLRERVIPGLFEYRRAGEEWRPLGRWWLPQAGMASAPVTLAPGRPFAAGLAMHGCARDGSLVFRPGEKYDVRVMVLSGAHPKYSNTVTIEIEPLPDSEVPAQRALMSRKLGPYETLGIALLGDLAYDAATLGAIRQFVTDFPDSVYSLYLRHTYVVLGARLPEQADVEAYAAYLKAHAPELFPSSTGAAGQ